MNEAGHADLIDAFRGAPDRIRRALLGMGVLLDSRPDPGAWTMREIVHHLVDAELISAVKLRYMLSEEMSQLDDAELARCLHYDRPIEAALEAPRRLPPRRRRAAGEVERC